MKKPHVLNRPMFNRGGTSAYGRGITSNLVSDEQRQRFNYGGRVGLRWGTGDAKIRDQYRIIEENRIPLDYLNQEYPQPYHIPKVKEWWNLDEEDTGLPSIEDLQSEEYYGPTGNYKPYQIGTATGMRGSEKPILARGKGEKGDVWIGEAADEIQEFPELEQGGSSKLQAASELEAAKKAAKERALDVPLIDQENIDTGLTTPLPADPESDVINWKEFAEGLYDKKGARGKAMLGLAGNVLAASQQPKKEAAAILGKGLGDFGKTWAARKEKMEDIAATGKMYEQIYKTREATKGKANLALAKWKKENASDKDLTDIQSYIGSMTGWKNKSKEDMTGETHQDIIGSFDEELAGETIILHPQTTGIGDNAVTTMPEEDQQKLNEAEEGSPIIIGEQIFIKDSSAPGGMRISSFTELKKLREAKSKKKKTYLDVAQGE